MTYMQLRYYMAEGKPPAPGVRKFRSSAEAAAHRERAEKWDFRHRRRPTS